MSTAPRRPVRTKSRANGEASSAQPVDTGAAAPAAVAVPASDRPPTSAEIAERREQHLRRLDARYLQFINAALARSATLPKTLTSDELHLPLWQAMERWAKAAVSERDATAIAMFAVLHAVTDAVLTGRQRELAKPARWAQDYFKRHRVAHPLGAEDPRAARFTDRVARTLVGRGVDNEALPEILIAEMFSAFPEWLRTWDDILDGREAVRAALANPTEMKRLAGLLGTGSPDERYHCARALVRLTMRARGWSDRKANNFLKGDTVRAYRARRRVGGSRVKNRK